MALEHLKGYAEEGHVDERDSQYVKIPTKVTPGSTAVSDRTIAEYNAAMRHPGGREAFYAEQGAADEAYLDYVTRRQRGAFGSGAGYGGQPSGFFNSGIAPWHLHTAAPSQAGALASAYGSQNARAAAVESQGLRNQLELAKLGVMLRGNVRERKQMTDLYADTKPDLDAIRELTNASYSIDTSTEKGKRELAENQAEIDRLWRKIQSSTPESYEQVSKTAPKTVTINDISYKQLPNGQLIPIVRAPDTTQTGINRAATRGSTDASIAVPDVRAEPQNFIGGRPVGGGPALPPQSGAAAGAPGAGGAASPTSGAPAASGASAAPAAPSNPMAGTKAGQAAGASSAPAAASAAPAAVAVPAAVGSPNKRGEQIIGEENENQKEWKEAINGSGQRASGAIVEVKGAKILKASTIESLDILQKPQGERAQRVLSEPGVQKVLVELIESGVGLGGAVGSDSSFNLRINLAAKELATNLRLGPDDAAAMTLLLKNYTLQGIKVLKDSGDTRPAVALYQMFARTVPGITDPFAASMVRLNETRLDAEFAEKRNQAMIEHAKNPANTRRPLSVFEANSEWGSNGSQAADYARRKRAVVDAGIGTGNNKLSGAELQKRINDAIKASDLQAELDKRRSQGGKAQ